MQYTQEQEVEDQERTLRKIPTGLQTMLQPATHAGLWCAGWRRTQRNNITCWIETRWNPGDQDINKESMK